MEMGRYSDGILLWSMVYQIFMSDEGMTSRNEHLKANE